MSVIGSQRSIFGDETGADGRVITDTDLNAISVNATRRAWEAPGYAGLMGFDEISSSGVRSYSDAFDGDTSALYSRMRGVFTIGRGLEVSMASLGTSVGSGFLGIWRDPDGPTPPPSSGANRMYWVSVSDGDIAATHTAAASGKTRWDLVCVTPSEVNASTVTRHFQDAITGDKSSQVVVPGRLPTITVSLTAGEESSGTPTLPEIPSGKYVVYAALVSDTAVTKVWDLTVPVGPLQDGVVMGAEGMFYGSEVAAPAWTPAQNLPYMKSVTSAAGDLIIFPPAHVKGAPDRRLMGVKISHKLYSGSTVKLTAFPTVPGASASDLVDLSASITRDGTQRTKVLDLRGGPYDVQSQPYWLNGLSYKNAADYAICLRINAESPTNTSYIYAVRWFYL